MKQLIVLLSVLFMGMILHAQQPLPCKSISQSDFAGTSPLVYSSCIESSTPLHFGNNTNAIAEASTSIVFKPGAKITVDNGGSFIARINPNVFEVVWFEPENSYGYVPKYNKVEFGIKLPENYTNEIISFIDNNDVGLNPFDPEDIAIEARLISPSGKERKATGFYYVPFERNISENKWDEMVDDQYKWRIRFCPDEIGIWSIKIYLVVSQSVVGFPFEFNFTCIPSDHKGYLCVSKTGTNQDKYLYYSETQETFFSIGHNICHSDFYEITPEKSLKHQEWLNELAQSGGNFFRLELGGQSALPDWDSHNNYLTKMEEMWELDQLIELAELKNLYFIMFRCHDEIVDKASWDVVGWDNNPYKTEFNLNKRIDYFNNPEVIKWQLNTLRYIFSRWGYSPSFAFYGYSEVDNWTKDMQIEENFTEKEVISNFRDWYINQRLFVKGNLGFEEMLFLNTYASFEDYSFELNKNKSYMFKNSDVVGFHKYGETKNINYSERYDLTEDLWNEWGKPVFIEEIGQSGNEHGERIGINCCTDIEFHNAIWSTSFMDGAGTGMHWNWNRGVHDFGFYTQYHNLQSFFAGEDLRSDQYSSQKWKDQGLFNFNSTTIEKLNSSYKCNFLF